MKLQKIKLYLYRNNQKTEDRLEAVKILQKKAWDTIISADENFSERLVGLTTAGEIWLKRKLAIVL